MRRLIYKIDSPHDLQIGLDDAEKQWLDTHSLDELKLDCQRACFKPRRRCTSIFRGVVQSGNKFIAQLTETVEQRVKTIFRRSYATEEEAARAWDHAAVRHRGRYTLPSAGAADSRQLT